MCLSKYELAKHCIERTGKKYSGRANANYRVLLSVVLINNLNSKNYSQITLMTTGVHIVRIT